MSDVTAQVCATSTSTNICGWKGTVHIRLCNESGSEYFVYLLPVPPGCPLAYCVDAASHKECIPPEVWLEDEFRCGGRSRQLLNNLLIHIAPRKEIYVVVFPSCCKKLRSKRLIFNRPRIVSVEKGNS